MQAWAESEAWNHPDPGTTLQERFDEAAATMGIALRTLPNAVVTRARLKTRGSELADIVAQAGGRIQSELLLTDETRNLFGILDISVSGGNGLIIDLKTGRSTSAALSPMTVHQMMFYVHLFATAYGAPPARTVVFSLQRGPAEITVAAADIASLLSDIENMRQEPSLTATPAPEICRFCTKRMICEPHWNALNHWPDSDAIEGLVERVERSSSGTVALHIAGKWLTGIPSEELPPGLQPGTFARAVRVRRRSDTTPEEWAATPLTSVRISLG